MITRSGLKYDVFYKEEPLVSLKEIRKIQSEKKKEEQPKKEAPMKADEESSDCDCLISETDII